MQQTLNETNFELKQKDIDLNEAQRKLSQSFDQVGKVQTEKETQI
jgi:hypothetical protein